MCSNDIRQVLILGEKLCFLASSGNFQLPLAVFKLPCLLSSFSWLFFSSFKMFSSFPGLCPAAVYFLASWFQWLFPTSSGCFLMSLCCFLASLGCIQVFHGCFLVPFLFSLSCVWPRSVYFSSFWLFSSFLWLFYTVFTVLFTFFAWLFCNFFVLFSSFFKLFF